MFLGIDWYIWIVIVVGVVSMIWVKVVGWMLFIKNRNKSHKKQT
jgi:hypothetical protein